MITVLVTANLAASGCGDSVDPACAKAEERCDERDCCDGLLYAERYDCRATRGHVRDCTCLEPEVIEDGGPIGCDQAYKGVGFACDQDCEFQCGFGSDAPEFCKCQNGVFTSCDCPRPDWYLGAPTAPSCDTIVPGPLEALDGTSCTQEWQQCFEGDGLAGRYAFERGGSACNGRGCACLLQPDGDLEWVCGAINGWFTAE